MSEIDWKTGFEIELIAPAGKNRRDLAQSIAKFCNGTIQTIFYPQSEPSRAAGVEVFENLVLGFDVLDANGISIACCVDDLTIQSDLDFHAKSKKGWYRIISDDARLLELVSAQCDPNENQRNVLQPLAKLFGNPLERSESELFKVSDRLNRSVAVAATLPGERERVCEIITSPISENHIETLSKYLNCAHELGFRVPREAAIHVHYDAKKLKNARVLCRLVEVLALHGNHFKQKVKTNPHCRRLGAMPTNLIQQCREPGFSKIGWKPARKQLEALGLSKYTDFNFQNLIHDTPGKNTFEVRIFPGSMDIEEVAGFAELFARVLNWCVNVEPDQPTPSDFETFLSAIAIK